jgi:adenylate cyclase
MPGHAMAALKTALNIIGSIPGVNRALAAKGLPSIAVGIGVHTGPVVAGSIGAKIRMEYGVIGDTVNTAARLVGVAPPMQIYTTAETVRCADGKVVVEPGGQLELKGKSKPIEVFRVLRLKDGSSA